ncbi:MAG: hypothetical protein E4H14_14560 [Candidatus Thorarchaeota archaeon]|nr:MAG: hypothetical protein E4H14_14560 [Candidatus Thorarchaeota archaeon]
MSQETTIESLTSEIEKIRNEMQAQNSNLFKIGLVVMILFTVLYILIAQSTVAYYSTVIGILSSIEGLVISSILMIIPLLIIVGFFAVNDFRR